MKRNYLIVLLAIFMIFLVGCNNNNAIVSDEEAKNPITEPNETVYEMPKPFQSEGSDVGGDSKSMFYQPCELTLDGIPVELLRLVEQSDYDNWKSKHNIFEKAPSSLTEYRNIYSFIVEFDISDEDVLSALDVYLNSDDPRIAIPEEDINVILSRDESAIVERFASEYSITVGEKIYSPQWVYEHSISDYKNSGITPEMIEGKLELYRNIGLSNEAALAFENKLTEFIGEKVNFLLLTLNTGVEKNANNTSKNDIKAFTVEWLTTHTILDYASNGITKDMVEEYLNKNKELLGPKEFDYIYSCFERMTSN